MLEPLELSLTNPRSDRIKAVRALSGRSARVRSGHLIVEGPQAVREAIRYAASRVRDLYLSEGAAQRYREIVDDALAARRHIHIGTDEVLQAISPDAQGVVAVLQDDELSDDAERLRFLASSLVGARLVAVLSQVRDPGNAGTVIRAADAAGADLVVLTESSVDVGNPKVIRSTAGSLFHLPVVTGLTLESVIQAVREAGLTVFAADGHGDVMLDGLIQANRADAVHGAVPGGLAAPTAWVFGNEAWGLTVQERALADAVVQVPLYGAAESLNLGTAAAVCLYASAMAQH